MIHSVLLMIVVGNDDFGERLAKAIDAKFVAFEQRTFPDGEVCPRIMGDIDKDVILVNHMKLPLETNRYFMETLLLVKTLQEFGAEKIDVVMPYFVYARQNKVFRSGEPFSAKYVLETLHKAGAKRFFTVSSHAERDKDKLTSIISAFNVNGFISIGNYLKKKNFSNPIIVGPDEGAEHFARTVSDIIGCEHTLLEKHRDLATGEVTMSCSVDLKNKNVIIIDDIVSSGSTMMPAIELCKKNGTKDVFVYVVHLVSEKGIEKISPHVREFLASDTIETPISRISIVEQLAEKLKTLE